MNIFVLDSDPVVAAQMQCNKHVVKMILESVQLLSCAIRLYGVDDERLYRVTHKNHPSAIWTRTNRSNFDWLVAHTHGLIQEYMERYNKIHASARILQVCEQYADVIPAGWLTVPPICDGSNDVVSTWEECVSRYRQYYINAKANICVWPDGKEPEWWVSPV